MGRRKPPFPPLRLANEKRLVKTRPFALRGAWDDPYFASSTSMFT